jgi:septal ring factor EnvC (AmiA/AmiB activator)
VINVYTYRQILFNAAVVRILNRWDARLRLLVTETGSFSEQVAEWLEGRIARVEERRGLWEARLASQLAALEDRASAAESDVAALEARARADRARIDSLEDSIRRLEGRLEREREGAGTGVLR